MSVVTAISIAQHDASRNIYVQTCQVFNPLIRILSSNVVNLFAKEDEDQEDEEEEEEQEEEEEEEDYFEEVRCTA